MSQRPLPSGPLVCARQFEASRLQNQFWEAAYQQVVPDGATTRGVTPRAQANAGSGVTHRGSKTNLSVSEDRHSAKGVCA